MIFSALLFIVFNKASKVPKFWSVTAYQFDPIYFWNHWAYSVFWNNCLFSKQCLPQCSNSKFVDMISTRPKFLLQLTRILQYVASDGEVGEPAFQKLCKHSWYVTEENVIFALFRCSAAVSNETKQKIADQLRLMPHPHEFRPGIPISRQKIYENTTNCLFGRSILDLNLKLYLLNTLGFTYLWLNGVHQNPTKKSNFL